MTYAALAITRARLKRPFDWPLSPPRLSQVGQVLRTPALYAAAAGGRYRHRTLLTPKSFLVAPCAALVRLLRCRCLGPNFWVDHMDRFTRGEGGHLGEDIFELHVQLVLGDETNMRRRRDAWVSGQWV